MKRIEIKKDDRWTVRVGESPYGPWHKITGAVTYRYARRRYLEMVRQGNPVVEMSVVI